MPETLEALREFFTHDRKRFYKKDELQPFFALGVPDNIVDEYGDGRRVSRKTLAGFIRGYVSPNTVSQAVLIDAPQSALVTEPVTVDLPRWLLNGLRATAKEKHASISSVIAMELMSSLEGAGLSSTFDDACNPLPSYEFIYP